VALFESTERFNCLASYLLLKTEPEQWANNGNEYKSTDLDDSVYWLDIEITLP